MRAVGNQQCQPDLRFLLAHPSHFVALGFGSGLSPKAPGTAGSLAAIPIYLLLACALSPTRILIISPVLFILGIYVCDKAGEALGVSDHGAIVWDEIVAMLALLAFAPQNTLSFAVTFLLFRVFDITKPWPIRWVDRQVKGGLGVMLDDAIAALPVAALLWCGKALLG